MMVYSISIDGVSHFYYINFPTNPVEYLGQQTALEGCIHFSSAMAHLCRSLADVLELDTLAAVGKNVAAGKSLVKITGKYSP